MEILSQMWSFLGLLTVLQNVLPSQILSLLHSFYESLQDFFSPFAYFEIPEFNDYCGVDVNDLYRHVNLYLNSVNPATTCRRFTLSRSKSSNRISFTVAPNHTVHDSFNGHTLSWTHHVETVQDSLDERRSFSLKLPKRHRQALLSPYLELVTSRAEEFERVSRERRLFTNNGHGSYESGWLTKVSDNSELRALLIQTTNRSIIVIEDIDCSVDLTADRLSKTKRTTPAKGSSRDEGEENGRVTLSGLLNFTDGLWSCCGEERIIVFTTNHRDNVDPALVRCGRMDVHVSLGTCGIHAFKALAANYLGLESHPLFDVVESCIRSGGTLTPAQVGEILLRNRRDAEVAIKAVISAMQARILGAEREPIEYEEMAKSPESVERGLMESPENWETSSPGKYSNSW
ncbi:unnamed protein product, partial [Vitis vinifera]